VKLVAYGTGCLDARGLAHKQSLRHREEAVQIPRYPDEPRKRACGIEPQVFAKKHGFRWIMEDHTAANPNLDFGVETFEPGEEFQPK